MNGVNLLICDDDEDTRALMSQMFKTHGFNVRLASTGTEALDAMMEGDVQIALMDIDLPDRSGLEVARVIRSQNLFVRPSLIAVTGRTEPAQCAEATEAGFDLYLVKPVTMRQLLTAMTTIPDPTDRLAS